MDCDEGDNSALTYELSGPDASLFIVDDNGDLYATGPLDYDNQDDGDHSYRFTVTAKDGGNPQLTAETVVSVILMNVNDESPMFQPESYTYYVDENAQRDYSIGTVYASDADGDSIEYGIAGGNLDNKFDIDPTAGKLYVPQGYILGPPIM